MINFMTHDGSNNTVINSSGRKCLEKILLGIIKFLEIINIIVSLFVLSATLIVDILNQNYSLTVVY